MPGLAGPFCKGPGGAEVVDLAHAIHDLSPLMRCHVISRNALVDLRASGFVCWRLPSPQHPQLNDMLAWCWQCLICPTIFSCGRNAFRELCWRSCLDHGYFQALQVLQIGATTSNGEGSRWAGDSGQ